ncbi:hypothetical protein GCM10010329_74100 [Streptomyces spiroverticillatus]|uniref:F5/8 type C domain-containing protein n=1 Tax=Streptomyces finlayi TaxID=67296 RepID=A0A918X6M7_9ACTN|nr:discoidin domain-containing protein [Streptomyces finlayi]GHA40239.1 hypothetical protein GCM10010329_74100 [Streptomyces spiroverticillatus]GHD15614.1 hypothetical protein GCM10010334_75970 [Streptomyces finlayi]
MSKEPQTRFSRRALVAAATVATAATVFPFSASAYAAEPAPPLTEPVLAADGTNARPVVIPALQEWAGGAGTYRIDDDTRVVVEGRADHQLLALARTLTEEIAEVTGVRLAVPRRGNARRGDIALRVDPRAVHAKGGELYRAEGYELAATERGLSITGPGYRGVFYGTRSLLQILLQDDRRTRIPVGTAHDWPNYRLRGFMLDVGRRFFTPGFIRDYLRIMGWFKLNELQLHLNDNEITAPGGDWSKAYDAFRLRSEKSKWDGLAAKDGSYDRRDWDSFEDVAAAHAVRLTPEIDAPAHSRSFVRFRPDIGLGGPNSDHLDLGNPATLTFMKEVFDEFTPWFRSPEVHYGADEYTGPESHYRAYFNGMAAHLRDTWKKRPRAWGSLTRLTKEPAAYDKQVTIHSWNNGWYGPQAAKKDGYTDIVNTNDGLLYVVPFATYYHPLGLDGRYLYDSWEPHVFPGKESLAPFDPVLRGAMSAVWNDLVHATYTEKDVHGLIEKTFGILAQKMWSGAAAGVPYGTFTTSMRRGALGPGLTVVGPTLAEPDQLSLGATAFASSSAYGTKPGAACDGSPVTRWSSRHEREPWLALDLGKVRGVGRVRLDWGQEYGRSYDIEVSADAKKWAKVAERRDRRAPGRDELSFDAADARYVRVRGRDGRPVRFTLWSVQVFDVPDLARGRATTASSAEVDYLGAELATDGDPGTRWASKYTDGEWISVDLGSVQAFRRVLLDWEAAAGKDYDVQVSDDGNAWRTVVERRGRTTAGEDTVELQEAVRARHVRMQGRKRQSTYGYSLWRFEIRA